MNNDKLERITEWDSAYDQRAEGYGVHGVNCRWIVKGERGAVQFLIYTNWMLQQNRGRLFEPDGADVGYHSKRPMYEGDKPIQSDCPYTGGDCYYDGSGLAARAMLEKLIAQGGEAVWLELESIYRDRFGDRP